MIVPISLFFFLRFAQIIPAFVREAYSLLRQSIIHVEQDDIDFDEEELEGEREGDQRARAQQPNGEESQDVEMSGGDVPMEDSEQTSGESMAGTNSEHQTPSTPRATSMVPEPAPAPAPPKRRMVITHDKYLTLQSLIVLHLSQIERETGKGLDRDELIDWYLETKEEEIQDIDELEYEKELITKMLRKLVKVSRFTSLCCSTTHVLYEGQLPDRNQRRCSGVLAICRRK